MANKLFQMFGGGQMNAGNLMTNAQGYQNPQMSFLQFASNFAKSGNKSPQAIGMQLLNSGLLSQSQLQQYGAIADRMVGRK